jgi:putative methyltransferase (TIGR04325 family)
MQANLSERIMKIVRGIAPPFALDVYRRLAEHPWFSGNFKTWDEARKASGGYDSDAILNRVKDALLKVKNGEAVYERDSVLFDRIHYSWPLLAGLLWVASRSGNRLNLIDFGGSLGSSYYQNRKFLVHLVELKWNIVEQEKFVECGKHYFEDDHLKFYHHIDDCMREQKSNAILLSSVLQYVEKPYDLIQEIIGKGLQYVLFDRTPFLEKADDRITIQKVPPEIYPASYPAWFFNLEKFLDSFSRDYELIEEFDSFESFALGRVLARNKGFIFLRK